MKPEPIVHPETDPSDKKSGSVPEAKPGTESALDEALEESFPASDPVAITIENPKPVEKTR
jgi:hypothetical protein